jgi:exonuclease VII small subunit
MERDAGLTAEMYRAVVAIVDDRVKEIRVVREEFDSLRQAVSELAQAQARTEKRVGRLEEAVERLAQAQARTDASVRELTQAQARTDAAVRELAQAQARTDAAVRELAKQVGALAETVGFGLEDVAKLVLPPYLERHYGLKLVGPPSEELTRRFFEVEGRLVEVNLYGEGRRNGQPVVVLGEVKSRIGGGEVHEFAADLVPLEPLVKGEVVRVMFGYYIHPSALEAATGYNILLVASYQR